MTLVLSFQATSQLWKSQPFQITVFLSEPSGIGLPGNRSALEELAGELACSDISSEPKPSDPSMTTDDSFPP